MTDVPPNDAELDELLDSALEDFITEPSPKPKSPAPDTAAVPAREPTADDKGFEDEFVRQLTQGMEDMFKNSSSTGDEAEMRTMLDQLLGQMGSLSAADTGTSPAPPPAATSSAEKPAAATEPTEPGTFEDKIKATMSKLKESADRADAESSDTGMGMLEELMQQLEQAGDDDNGMGSLVDDVIGQLMSKEVLQQPLRELDAAYPKYLETHKQTLSSEDYGRYQQQHEYVKQILGLFAECKDDSVNDPRIVELLQKMQDCGQPPNELLKLLAPEMELDEKGEVKAPEMPNCTIM
ncbi:Peroxisome chaperone and import receptor [Coemansia sp. RSA 2711]|nr:Peroxisome chaperone and import receptor [Coemansia sp. RSA 2711]KAJ2314881.1 Peroxisome chaperone and import receptor [Coemansia sp. RSA 2705]KAJ2320511.1 Peroxisome chaperone and import receptor [Coemansia sp. RSA 2704]KAJ2379305.1 Peroxisome chaperone and import receptor [Coemansia sp. RSA 2611]